MQSSAALPNSVGLTAYYTHSQNGQCANCSATLLDFHLNVVLLPCQTQLYTTIVLKCLESILKFIEPFCFYFFVLFLIRQRLLKLSRYRGAKVVLSYGRASLAERKQRRLKRTCKISPCPMYAGCLRHRNSDIRDEQKFFCVQLYVGTNKTQPFESNTFQRLALGTRGNVASRKYFRFHVIALYFFPEEVLDRLSIFMEYQL